MRISSNKFYVAERDENAKGEPPIWVVSKDEKQNYTFAKKNNFWVLVEWSHEPNSNDYKEIRDMIKDIER